MEPAERHQVDVHRVQHQLDAEKDADGVPARDHPEHPNRKKDRGESQIGGKRHA